MKILIKIMFFSLFLFSFPNHAGEYKQAVKAYGKENYQLAFHIWKVLAEKGDFRAQRDLGLMLQRGAGIKKNLERAAFWYEKAATQGSTLAQFNLAEMKRNGFGVSKNHLEAANWYLSAAENGHRRSQFELGVMYDLGQGVIKNTILSLMWLTIAQEAGDNEAERYRQNVEKDMSRLEIQQAKGLAKRCAEQNYKKCGQL